MGKSYLLFAALLGFVYCVNAASISVDVKPNTVQVMPKVDDAPTFVAIREKRGYGFDDENVEEHEHHHASHDEHHSEHHEQDSEKHHVSGHHQGHEEYEGHHGHQDYEGQHGGYEHGHHQTENLHEYGHQEHAHKYEHDHDEQEHKHGLEHGIEFGYHHGLEGHKNEDYEEHDDEDHKVSVHVGQFNNQKSSHLKKKQQSGFEHVKEVKYEVEKTKFNSQSELQDDQQEQQSGFTFES